LHPRILLSASRGIHAVPYKFNLWTTSCFLSSEFSECSFLVEDTEVLALHSQVDFFGKSFPMENVTSSFRRVPSSPRELSISRPRSNRLAALNPLPPYGFRISL